MRNLKRGLIVVAAVLGCGSLVSFAGYKVGRKLDSGTDEAASRPASERTQARAATTAEAKRPRPRLPSLKPKGVPGLVHLNRQDTELQREGRERLVSRMNAWIYTARPTRAQMHDVFMAIHNAQDKLLRYAEAEEAAQYDVVNVGKLRGREAVKAADEAVDEREAQLVEDGRSKYEIIRAEMNAELAQSLTPEQLDAWGTFDLAELEVVGQLVTIE